MVGDVTTDEKFLVKMIGNALSIMVVYSTDDRVSRLVHLGSCSNQVIQQKL